MIPIDGSSGEGGGQILRTSLSLSAVTGEPVSIENVRARRAKPGLMRQHLTALNAACAVCGGRAEGAEIGSRGVRFFPGGVRAGDYAFSVGTAGSAILVLQTILPVLLRANAPSTVKIAGGTHNPASPTFDHLVEAYLPALRLIGHRISARIDSYGFYPAGGGAIEVRVEPSSDLSSFILLERGKENSRSLEAVISNLEGSIAERELSEAGRLLDILEGNRRITTRKSVGPGNVLYARFEYEFTSAIFAQFGQRNVSSEQVAQRLAKVVKSFIASGAAVTHHLADQLLLPMALAKGGRFSTLRPSLHARSNAEVVEKFVDVEIGFEPADRDGAYICVVE